MILMDMQVTLGRILEIRTPLLDTDADADDRAVFAVSRLCDILSIRCNDTSAELAQSKLSERMSTANVREKTLLALLVLDS